MIPGNNDRKRLPETINNPKKRETLFQKHNNKYIIGQTVFARSALFYFIGKHSAFSIKNAPRGWGAEVRWRTLILYANVPENQGTGKAEQSHSAHSDIYR